MGKTVTEINNRIKELRRAKECFLRTLENLGNDIDSQNCSTIDSWNCRLSIELIDKEISDLYHYHVGQVTI
jgi:hypothetical protein